MKKTIITLLLAVFSLSTASAISLFPFFIDVSGDYKEGTPEKLVELKVPCMYYCDTPSFYKTMNDAESFLHDALPFSTESISREESALTDKIKMIKYSSSFSDNEKLSEMYLIEIKDYGFIIGYNELGN